MKKIAKNRPVATLNYVVSKDVPYVDVNNPELKAYLEKSNTIWKNVKLPDRPTA